MTEAAAVVVAASCAIAGAASFGLASAVQQRATKQVPEEQALNPKLLVRLVRNPRWLAGGLALLVGLTLQLVALAFGPLVLVQPVGVTSALFGAVFAASLARQRLDRNVLLAALACVAGLAVFLLLAQPSGRAHDVDPLNALPLALVLGLLVITALLAAARFAGEVRALALAAAAGVFYGVTAGLLKLVAEQVRAGGIGEPFQHWSLYLALLLGPPGFLLSQNAFQQGRLVSLALAVITTVDPLVAVAVGVGWLGERVVTTPAALAGEAVAAVAVVGGVAVLVQRGQKGMG